LYGIVINSKRGLFTNNPSSHADSVGVPPGHPSLKSFLGVPLVLDGKIMGALGVANREGGYGHEQQEDLEAIVPAVM
jgi:GAF domain-containing protein